MALTQREVIQLGILLLIVPMQYLLSGNTGQRGPQALPQWKPVQDIWFKLESWKVRWLQFVSWILRAVIQPQDFTSTHGDLSPDLTSTHGDYSPDFTSTHGDHSPAIEVLQYRERGGYFATSIYVRNERPLYVRYRIGQVVKHRTLGYKGVIAGWDLQARAPESWLQHVYGNNKINSKYSEELAQESLEWVKAITQEDISISGDMDNFYEVLKDGTLLCRLVNCIKPGSAKKINQSTMAFKCMENINVFLEAARDLGVPPQETFQTVDLWERQNLNSVVICLQSLGRKAGTYGKPSIGPKEAEKNVRNFSDEQMRAGQGVISLQYGSNKGANQSGINFGNTRHM